MKYGEAVSEFEEFFSERYYEDVDRVIREGKDSIVVDFQEMDAFNFELSEFLKEKPNEGVAAAEEGVKGVDLITDEEIRVRFANMPEEDFVLLRNLRSQHLGDFIPVEGMIKRASQVKPEVISAEFQCTNCGEIVEKEQDSSKLKSPYKCESCGSRKFEVYEKIMTDTQIVTVEENPESREGSEQPQSLSVRLEGDLVDPDFQKKIIPGNVVHITGVLRERPMKKDSKKYDIYMEANNVEPTEQEFEQIELDDEEKEKIEEMANEPDIFERIVDSIAPSIFGHREIKKAIALQLFGGVKKGREDGVKSRGDIHILLIGEPGTGKSQLLKFTGELAPKGRYVVGKSSTGAGLCVTGDTIVHTEQGLERIDNVVEETIDSPVDIETASPSDKEVYSFDGQEIEKQKASMKWRMPEKECYKVTTSFGKEVEASENTTILTAGEEGLEWKEISQIEENDYIAAPEYAEINREKTGTEPFVKYDKEKLKLSDSSIETIRDSMTSKYGSLRKAAEELNLSESFVYTSLTNRFTPYSRLENILEDLEINLSELEVEQVMLRNGSKFTIPNEFSEDLMYLIGLVFGDGDIDINTERAQVRISNSNENILKKAQEIIKREFNKDVKIERQEDRVPVVRIPSKTIAKMFERIGMQSPKENLKLDSKLTTHPNADSFLKGLMDADGCVVSRDGGSDSVQFSTVSVELGKQVQLMLETFGIKAKRRTRDRRGINIHKGQKIESKLLQTHLAIRGANIDTYNEKIGFSIKNKQETLQEISGKRRNSNNETVPISKILNKSNAKSGRHWTYFNQEKNPGHSKATEILKEVNLETTVSEKAREIAESQLKWEKVTEARKTGKKELFDLSVPESHNFIGNGILTHNTASVVKEESTGEFSLEAGAVVLAHKGMAAIDEIDKMAAEDRSSLHEAMEQQQISVSKANIQATLNAETSILAAGNPKLGRFDPYEPIPQQINIGDTLLSRFDFIFPVKDEPDEEKDAKLSSQVLKNHIDPEETDAEIEQKELRKYIAYAKQKRPELTQEAADKIQDFYISMRSRGSDEENGNVPITARQLEALVRIAEASARAELDDKVTEEDAERAIEILKYCLEQVGVDPETGEFDADIIESGVSSSQRNRLQSVKHVINNLAGDDEVEIEEVLDKAESEGLEREQAEEVIERLKRDGELYEPKQGFIQKI